VNEDEMGEACGMNGTDKKGKQHFVPRACGKGTVWQTARRWRDNM